MKRTFVDIQGNIRVQTVLHQQLSSLTGLARSLARTTKSSPQVRPFHATVLECGLNVHWKTF